MPNSPLFEAVRGGSPKREAGYYSKLIWGEVQTVHILFISSFLGPVGGIETLIARMSKWLLNKGHKVTLLTTTAQQEGRENFHKELRIVELGDELHKLCFPRKAREILSANPIEAPDVIKAFDLTASWMASILSSAIKPVPKVVFGNYFPYMLRRSSNPFKNRTFRLFLLNLGKNFSDDSILCMSENQISEFKQYYGNHRHPKFWPLPVEMPNTKEFARIPEWGCLVSISRLAPMKEYNLYMIDVVARLRRKGYPITWTVYGEGEFAEIMKIRINSLGLNDAIQLKGWLPYSQLAAVMSRAYAFVGMGTSVIEAALCGVPTVVAMAYDSSGVTYGPLYEFPFGNVGEIVIGTPAKTTVESEIERILNLQEEEYKKEMQKTRDYAKAYDIDSSMNKFLEILARAAKPKPFHLLPYWYYPHSLFERVLGKIVG